MTAPHVVTPADLPSPYSGPPLRIAYVGNFRHPWCTEVHVAGSLELLGHTVLRWQEDECDWSFVPSNADRLGVQLLVWTRTWPAEMAAVVPALKELHSDGIPSVSFHLDRWFGLDRQHQVDDQPFFRTDLVVSPDDSPLWPEHGVNHFWLPPGVYGPECEPVPPNPRRWPYDVVFVGSHPYPHPEWAKYRSDLISAFSRAFRGRFGILPRRGVPIRGRDLQELYATVPVVLGDSCLAGDSTMYWSDRCPESIARGATLIHPIVQGMDAWYEHIGPKQVMLGYFLGDFGQAVECAKWGIAHPEMRRTITDRGRALCLARDTYAHRMGTVLAVAEGIHGGYRETRNGPWERASPEVEREAGVSFSAAPNARVTRLDSNNQPVGRSEPVFAELVPDRLRAQLLRWSAIFEPRPGTTDSEVVGEVWRNDYRVPPEGFSGTVCIDVGSNIGAFTVLAAKAGARVVAVEPEPQNRARLLHHLALNRVADQVTVIAEAVTDRTGDRVRIADTGGGAHIDTDGVEAFTVSFAELIDKAAPIIAMIKFDAEMAEWLAFESVDPVFLRERVKRISLEWHSPVVMPHLQHLDDGRHMERWSALVAKLADCGRLEIFGHPSRGGLLWWSAF